MRYHGNKICPNEQTNKVHGGWTAQKHTEYLLRLRVKADSHLCRVAGNTV